MIKSWHLHKSDHKFDITINGVNAKLSISSILKIHQAERELLYATLLLRQQQQKIRSNQH